MGAGSTGPHAIAASLEALNNVRVGCYEVEALPAKMAGVTCS